jgi:hypothetical protein
MAKITLEAEQLQAITDTLQTLQSQNATLQRSQDERAREDAARAESRQRQHSLSIAADAEERNRGRAHQIEWDAAYENLARIAPAQREGETADAYRLRLASGVQNCSPDHKDLDLDTTFIHEIMAATAPRRIIRRMFGVDRIGDGSARPVEKPHNMGRMNLHHGLPRT